MVVDEKNLTVRSTRNDGEGLNFSATLDVKYKTKSKYKKIRFVGEENGNLRHVVASAEMLRGSFKMKDGTQGGFVQIRGTEDGYWSANYKCITAPMNSIK